MMNSHESNDEEIVERPKRKPFLGMMIGLAAAAAMSLPSVAFNDSGQSRHSKKSWKNKDEKKSVSRKALKKKKKQQKK